MGENSQNYNHISLSEAPPLKQTVNSLTHDFKGLATQTGSADKYAAMIITMPIYMKFQELTNGIQNPLRFTAEFWQKTVKKEFREVLKKIENFLISYENHYAILEKNLSDIKNPDTEKEVLIHYLQEIIANAHDVRSKINWVKATALRIFMEMVEGHGRRLKEEAIPAIQKAIRVTDQKIIDTQGKLVDVKQLITANEKLLFDLGIGMAGSVLSIFLGVGAILLGGFISSGFLLVGGIVGVTATATISAKVERELREQRNKEQRFIKELNELNSDSLYLKTMESDFLAIAGQTSQVIAVFNNLMTGWENILNSLMQFQNKLQTVSSKLQKDELRYIRGSFKDAQLEFSTMKQKIVQYGMVINMSVVDQVSMNNRIVRAAPYSLSYTPMPTPIPNELYFRYQSLAIPSEGKNKFSI